MTKTRHDIEVAALLREAVDAKLAAERQVALQRASAAVRATKTRTFEALARASGLDPKRHYRHADWRGMDFSGCNLRGFDFTGARLWGAKFDGALIGPGPDRDGNPAPAAIFDQAEWSAVSHHRSSGSTDPGILLAPVADLSVADDYSGYLLAWRPGPVPPRRPHLRPGVIFQDAPFAPEMVVVPSGMFLLGDERQPVDGIKRREVTIAHRLAVGRFPVTFEEWVFCHDDGGTKHKSVATWGRGRQPVDSVSWNDITKSYLPRLNRRLGLSGANAYRLLSEAEWEYCCRAGTVTAYSSGDTITKEQAQFSESRLGSAKLTVEVGTFPSNAWGLHDMHGNIWEWCQDVFHETYERMSDAGKAREDSPKGGPISRVLRGGGSSDSNPLFLRSAFRDWYHPGYRNSDFGFRVARTLNPAP